MQLILVMRCSVVHQELVDLQLVVVVPALEQRLPRKRLREDAAHGPNVHRGPVVPRIRQEFRGPVPTRHDVLRQRVLVLRVHAPREAEVADRQVAVGVHEQVRRLEIAVEHVRAVHPLEPAEDLVQEVLRVLLAERLRGAHDPVQVALHELRDDVHVLEVFGQRRHRADVDQADDVFMPAEVAQQLDFPQDALRIDEIFESGSHCHRRRPHHDKKQ